jgi:sulfur-carrier protein adenylyltransferase/sulfurtransferase
MSMAFSKEELKRYSRQLTLEQVGVAGQMKLKQASVLIVGVGGLGSPASLYLAAAGVGRIGIIDFDIVDNSNLHRQVLYTTSDEGQSKAEVARRKLLDLNPCIQVEAYNQRLTAKNAADIFSKYDYICDGADNFSTRYLVNDAAHFAGKPLISSSVLGFEGQFAVFNWNQGPCYRCLYPEPPPAGSVPSCAEAGVLGVLPGVMGSLQATAVLKLILDLNPEQKYELVLFDAIQITWTNLEISRNPDCPLCGIKPSIFQVKETVFACETIENIAPKNLHKTLGNQLFQVLDVREDFERQICHISGSLHIPLAQLETKWTQLSQETPVVIYCKSGGRSRKACELLIQKGFHCQNLEGGILKWIEEVQPELTRY